MFSLFKIFIRWIFGKVPTKKVSGKKETPENQEIHKIIQLPEIKTEPRPDKENSCKISFKTSRIEREFNDLKTKNNPLRLLIVVLAKNCRENYGKYLTITGIYRTPAEQKAIYGNTARWKKRPFKSPHEFYDACDLRSSNFTPKEIKEMVDFLNEYWNENNYFKWTALYHEVGDNGWHFHIQYKRV